MATITKYNIPRSSNSGENNGSNSVASLGGGLGLNEIKESFLPAKPTDEEQTKYDVEVEGTFKKNVTLPSITLVNGSKTATISLDTNGNIIVDKALISYSDLVAYGANGTYVDTVISLIHQVLEEEGVSGGGDVNWGGITGTGNAVTNITYNTTTKQLSAVKGATFLTSQDVSGKADKSSTVSNVSYDSTNKKITKTINGTTSDVVSVSTLKSAMDAVTSTDLGNAISGEVQARINAINALDVANVGGSGKYIQSISQTDGKISATSATLNKSSVGLSNVDNTADADKNVASATVADYSLLSRIYQHSTNNIDYPVVWSNSTNNATDETQLFKSYKYLTYNPSRVGLKLWDANGSNYVEYLNYGILCNNSAFTIGCNSIQFSNQQLSDINAKIDANGVWAGTDQGHGGGIYVDGCKKIGASVNYNNATYVYGDSIVLNNNADDYTLFRLHASAYDLANNCCNNPFRFNKGLKAYNICIECDNAGANYSARSSEINNYTAPLYLQHNTSNNLLMCGGGGNVGIGTSSPATKLHIVGTTDTGLSTHGLLVLGATDANNLSMDQNEIQSRNNGAVNTLYLNAEGGNTIICENGGNVGIGKSPSTKLDVNGRIKTTASTSTTAGGGIEIGNCKLLQLSNSIMCFADEFRFAAKDAGWDWNQWAGLKYDSSSKKIYMGIADGTVFNKNGNALTGGTVQLVNCGLVASGDVTAYSDARLKSDIKDLEFRGSLEPKSYIKDGKKCIGFIAQEVRELYPELVQGEEKEDEYLSLNYGAITAVLAAENKGLRKRIERLEMLINKLMEK